MNTTTKGSGSSHEIWRILLVAGAALVCTAPVHAVDGVTEINQARALAGGVTPGDTPGFPVSIKDAGSYRLTGNLDVRGQPEPENVTAIEIITGSVPGEGVTLDLNGFVILGSTDCSTSCSPIGSGIGISIGNFSKDVTIMNGNIRGMGSHGISTGGRGMRVERVNVSNSGGNGVVGGSLGSIIKNCAVHTNGGTGIDVASSALVIGNTVSHNSADGIDVSVFSQVTNNTVNNNGGVGIIASGLIIGNLARNNAGLGLQLSATAGHAAYSQNHVTQNNGGNANPQVSGGIEIGTNLCGDSTTCP